VLGFTVGMGTMWRVQLRVESQLILTLLHLRIIVGAHPEPRWLLEAFLREIKSNASCRSRNNREAFEHKTVHDVVMIL